MRSVLVLLLAAVSSPAAAPIDTMKVTKENIQAAESIIGFEFTDAERDSMLESLKENLIASEKLRTVLIDNSVPPALQFNPIPVGFKMPTERKPVEYSPIDSIKRPQELNDLAFYSVRELADLIRTRQVTSVELTDLFIARLKKYDPQLHCVITLTEERALAHAAKADQEIAAGRYRGPLHGIPYGAKDLLAAKGYKTTWGSVPYKDQVIDADATVIQKLDSAGAILVAKMTLGELAWGDVWFGEKTRNPWDTSQGSSGSSAGSASAVAAGLLPFAIGTETWGSIVSPSTRCGTTGLRPTYGRVSRTGAMALSWTMDKIGPICRTVEDCAIVFDAIIGPDGVDQTLIDAPFTYSHHVDLSKLRIGYLAKDMEEDTNAAPFDRATIAKLKEMGGILVEIKLPDYPIDAMSIILSAEAAAAFDELTRSGRDDLMIRQIKNAWPNVFRASRFIPAVEYIQANRLRYKVIQEMAAVMEGIDVYVSPSFGGNNLLLTNLTSHPCVVLPNGFDSTGHPTSITFMSNLYDEATLLAVAKAYQDATDFHRQHPKNVLP
ncbi:MAG: amidase [candidate division Zixibacteria bacterium]|nr:amidase [candidate division Zixibacteria bacterium]